MYENIYRYDRVNNMNILEKIVFKLGSFTQNVNDFFHKYILKNEFINDKEQKNKKVINKKDNLIIVDFKNHE